MLLTSCPTCQNPIDTERIIQHKAYCECGNIVDLSVENETSNDLVLLKRLALLVIVGTLIAAHCIAWGSYSFDILPLKAKQLVGVASLENLQTIASICETQKHWACEIQALADLYQKSENETSTGAKPTLGYLARLAHVQSNHNEQEQANSNYALYIHDGGSDPAVRLEYANLLASMGDVADARTQFAYLVNRRSPKPQFEVAREYVHFLMKNHDYPTAKNVIRRYRRFGPTASLFLNDEWVEINDQLRAERRPAAIN